MQAEISRPSVVSHLGLSSSAGWKLAANSCFLALVCLLVPAGRAQKPKYTPQQIAKYRAEMRARRAKYEAQLHRRERREAALAPTPPMGWNSWNHFAGRINARIVRQTADAMVASGMQAAGYKYINIDDTWEGRRDARGRIHPNAKFGSMKALAGYLHSKGLKLGIYSSPGPKTCAGYAGSYRHVRQDARSYARWGIDYLKYDWCSASQVYKLQQLPQVYLKMYRALKATGRPIVFSLCEYGWLNPWHFGPFVGGNLWRTTGDINDTWKRMSQIGFSQSHLAPYAAPGLWNDPDMLEVGNGGMTEDEYRTHMSLWAMLAAPLIAGNDLRHMSASTRALLTNGDVIAVDQDRLGRQGYRIWRSGRHPQQDREIWIKPLAGGASAVAFFNRGPRPASLTLFWSQLELRPPLQARNLWTHQNHSLLQPAYTVSVASHGVVLLRVKPTSLVLH